MEARVPQELNDPKIHRSFDVAPEERPRTRLGRLSKKPSFLKDYHACTSIHVSLETPSYEATTTDQDWKKAMIQEMNAILENGSWELTKLALGKRALSTKWVFKAKDDIHGNLQRRKARLVVRGYEQREGIDYEETFTPVV